MKKHIFIKTLTAFALVISISAAHANDEVIKGNDAFDKGKYYFGISGIGSLNFSNRDSFFTGTNVDLSNYITGGFGVQPSFNYSFNEKWSLTVDGYYEYRTLSNKLHSTLRRNYFGADVLGRYTFQTKGAFVPYVVGGVGMIASSGKVYPLADLGAGFHYFFTPNFSLKTQVVAKSALVFNRVEGSVGLAWHLPMKKPAPVVIAPPPEPEVRVITLTGVNFDTDKFSIREDSIPILENNISELNVDKNVTIKIIGHTDDRGSETYNQTLSENRAKAVMEYFIGKGIDGTRMTYEGRGETSPVVPNDSKENMFQNRRIEIEITSQ